MSVNSVSARAPAKLIITGEHSVLYGCDALTVALARYLTVTISPSTSTDIYTIEQQGHHSQLRQQDCARLTRKIDQRFNAYLQQKLTVDAILQDCDLLHYTLARFALQYQLPTCRICIQSEIPPGFGLGSSSALLLALLAALHRTIGHNISDKALAQEAKHIEHYQHGQSSGIDIHTCLYGGAWHFQPQQSPCQIPIKTEHLYYHLLAPAQSSTGQCVSHVKQHMTQHTIEQFQQVSQQIVSAVQSPNYQQLHAALSTNQHLLQQLGIVPQQTQQTIAQWQQQGFCAKQSGAGSVQDDHSGVLLLCPHDASSVPSDLAQAIHLDTQGLVCNT